MPHLKIRYAEALCMICAYYFIVFSWVQETRRPRFCGKKRAHAKNPNIHIAYRKIFCCFSFLKKRGGFLASMLQFQISGASFAHIPPFFVRCVGARYSENRAIKIFLLPKKNYGNLQYRMIHWSKCPGVPTHQTSFLISCGTSYVGSAGNANTTACCPE